MSSTLIFEKVEPKYLATFKQPIKGVFSKYLWGTDGSCGDGSVEIDSDIIPWLDGAIAAGNFEKGEISELKEIRRYLAKGGKVRVYHKY